MGTETWLLAFTCFAAGFLPAQTRIVFPRDHKTVEGYSYDARNHFSAGVSRIQLLYEQDGLQLPQGAKITQFGFRQDGARALSGKSIQVEVRMGASSKTVETMGTTFARNYTGSPVTVIGKKILNLPTFGAPAGKPAPNWVMVKLDRPYDHDASKNLIVDILVHANNNASKGFDYPLDYARYLDDTESFGQSCKTSSGATPKLTTGPAWIGGSWTWSISNAPASTANVAIVGSRQLANPISLKPVGAEGCYLFIDVLAVVVTGATNANGYQSIRAPMPNDHKLYGVDLYMQTLQPDVFANRLGIVFSNGVRVKIGRLPQSSLCYRTGSTSSQTGLIRRHNGLVTCFEHR